MNFLDRLRPKWQHSDPLVRERAVRQTDDQDVLERVVSDDPHPAVRFAALERLTDARALARFAREDSDLALPAMRRLRDPAQILSLGLTAERAEVRSLAVDQIDDELVLHRIATSDLDPAIRSKARRRCGGADATRTYLRQELSKLQHAQAKTAAAAEICATLDDACAALVGHEQFQLDGRVESDAGAETADGSGSLRFLARRHPAAAAPDAAEQVFYEVEVWRTEQGAYAFQAAERRTRVVRDANRWSRVSNGATVGAPRPRPVPAA